MPKPIALTRLFEFRGDSMLPLLETGDEVWVRAAEAHELAPGSLLVWARFHGGRPSLVVHRLVASPAPGGGGAVTRGDARSFADEPFEPADFLGTVVAIRRKGALLNLGSAAGRLYDRACYLCARLFLRGRAGAEQGPLAGPLRQAALSQARRLFRLLASRP